MKRIFLVISLILCLATWSMADIPLKPAASLLSKAAPVANDNFIILDSAAGNAMKKVPLSSIRVPTATALAANKVITDYATKTTPSSSDWLLLSDQAAGGAYKKTHPLTSLSQLSTDATHRFFTDDLLATLIAKQDALTNASTIAKITESAGSPLWNGGAWPGGSGGSMTYPGSGVPNSTGSSWGSSYSIGTSANNLVQLNGSAQLPAVSGANLTNVTAAGLSGQYIDFNASSGPTSIANKPTITDVTSTADGDFIYGDGTNFAVHTLAATKTKLGIDGANLTNVTAAGLSGQYIDFNASSGPTSIANKPTITDVTSTADGDFIYSTGSGPYIFGVHDLAATKTKLGIDGKEASLGNPGTSGYVLSSTTGGTRSWIAPGGGGSFSFDTFPTSSTSAHSSGIAVNSTTGALWNGTKWMTFALSDTLGSPPISDDFSTNDIANWTNVQNHITISGGVAHGDIGALNMAYWNAGSTATDDNQVTATIILAVNGDEVGGIARWNTAAGTGYLATLATNAVQIYKFNGSTLTLLDYAYVSCSTGTQYTFKLTTKGTSLSVYLTDMVTPIKTITDSTYTTGKNVGLIIKSDSGYGDDTIDNFVGGDTP